MRIHGPLPKNLGFTLIELLVVITIIGLLSSIVLVNLSSARVKERDARRKADMRSLELAVQLYYHSNGTFPNNDYTGWWGGVWSAAYQAQLSPYISPVPTDPFPSRGLGYVSYRLNWAPDPKCNNRYVVWAYLESTSDPDYGKYSCGFDGSLYIRLLDFY